MPIIKLKSFDGEILETDVQVAKCSGTIKTMLEDCGMDEGDEIVVPLPNVNSAILRRILEWAEHHKDDPVKSEDDDNKEKRNENISTWDADFLKIDQDKLCELLVAANYLDIKGLLHVACTTIANMCQGKTPEEIRQTFKIKNDLKSKDEEESEQSQ